MSPTPGMLALIMYVYLIMLHFDVQGGVDEINMDGLASQCLQCTGVFIGWHIGTR